MARDEDLDLLEGLADRMGLDDKQAESFINQGMQKLGYRPRMDWDDPDPEEGKDNATDMFGGGGNQRRQRRVGGNRQQQDQGNRRSGGDWQYGS